MALVALTDSVGDIDTSDQLSMFELAQKVFVVNGRNKKVADFANTKLTISALTNPPMTGDILVQGSAPNQKFMVVDFVTTAKTTIYGRAYYSGTATAWETGSFTSNNVFATMSPSSGTITAVTDGPHWYDWTPFPDVVLAITAATRSFGEMPERVYLGCAYMGRAVLSGDPEAPFQWYMARTLNPWDWAYAANDAGSPMYGGASNAGQVGDIIRALIPYKDDYLIFGCSASMHVLGGNPASHGELRELSLTTGIFGANSFCWDDRNQLYFFGNNGVYRVNVPGAPVSVSLSPLPKMIKELLADQSSHRITMGYDRMRNGILICSTRLATGENKNFWYDLKVADEGGIGGFFPEDYPNAAGVYSTYFYDSPDADGRALLVGCADGYIRKFDESSANDVLHDSESAIESEVNFGPYSLSGQEDFDGVLTGLNAVLAGGDTGGLQSDSDPVDYEIYAERSSETLIEKMAAGIAKVTGVFRSSGRQRGTTKNQRVRSAYIGLRLKNNRVSESWGFEKLLLSMSRGGRQK